MKFDARSLVSAAWIRGFLLSFLVIVPVVDVRPVGVGVLIFLVRVRVRVGRCARVARVFVFVVSVIMAVPVLMRHPVVLVDVLMPLAEQKQQ